MSDDLKQRLIGVLYLLPFVIGAILGQSYLGIVIGILQLLISYEIAKILSHSKNQLIGFTMIFFVTSLSPLIAAGAIFSSLAIIAGLVFVCLLAAFFVKGLFAAIFSGIVGICLASLSVLAQQPESLPIFIALVLIIASGDIGAYFVGRLVGGRKLAPSISPGKTLSGAIGGLLCSMGMAVLFASPVSMISANPLVAGLVIGVLAQAGDLYESAFKRRAGIKDSSNLIPGHGGFLDRFDGYLLVVPLIAWFLTTQGM